MNNKYNYINRDHLGRFAPKVKVVAGRLYDFRGAVVRAGHLEGDKRFVSFHRALTGLVPDSELRKIKTNKVNQYLENAY